jgi:uncharacterized membrane protein
MEMPLSSLSSEGWVVGADGIYNWQEEVAGFPTNYLIIIIAVIVVVVAVVWFFIKNRRVRTKRKKGNAGDVSTSISFKSPRLSWC